MLSMVEIVENGDLLYKCRLVKKEVFKYHALVPDTIRKRYVWIKIF